MCRVCDGAHGWRAALVVDVSDGLCAHVQHQGVDQLNVVAVPRLIRHLEATNAARTGELRLSSGRAARCSYLQVATQLRQEGDGRTGLQVRVQVLLELRGHDACEVGEDPRSNVDLAQHVHLFQKQTQLRST